MFIAVGHCILTDGLHACFGLTMCLFWADLMFVLIQGYRNEVLIGGTDSWAPKPTYPKI